jgi:hypothetical protein
MVLYFGSALAIAAVIIIVLPSCNGRSAIRDLRDIYVAPVSPNPAFAACASEAYAKKNMVTDDEYMTLFNDCISKAGVQGDAEDFFRMTQSAPIVSSDMLMSSAQFAEARECARLAEISGLPEDAILSKKQECFNSTK